MSALRTIYKYWVSLMTLAVVLQIGFAGVGAFGALDKATDGSVDEDGFLASFDPHAILGSLIVLSGLILFLLSFSAGRRRVYKSLGIFVLLIAQMMLGWTGSAAPWLLGLLHPINALLILALLGSTAAAEWGKGPMGHRAAATMPPPAMPPPAA
jgi:hypothetical protein